MAAGLVLSADIVGGANADEVDAVGKVDGNAGRGSRLDAGAGGLSAAGGFGTCAVTLANSVATNISQPPIKNRIFYAFNPLSNF